MRPIVFVDLDETLVHTTLAESIEQSSFVLDGEPCLCTVRNHAAVFLARLKQMADVYIFSMGTTPYIRCALISTGLVEYVDGYFSARTDVLHSLLLGSPWVLVDNMPLESDFIANKMLRITPEWPSIDANKHFVQVDSFEGVQDLDLFRVLYTVSEKLRDQSFQGAAVALLRKSHTSLSSPLQLRRDYGSEEEKEDSMELPKSLVQRVAYRYLTAKERSDEEKDEIYSKWRELINMSQGALDKWGENPERLEASLNRSEAKESGGIQSGYDSFRRIQRRKSKPKNEWSAEDYDNAAQENGFNTRMIGNEPGKPVSGTDKSKWEISLLNWGHDPSLKSSLAHSKWKKWKESNAEDIKQSLAKADKK